MKLPVVLAAASATALTLMATAPPASAKGDPAAARDKNSMCAGCHGIPGYHASFPRVYRVPMIAGQSPGYLEAALQAYRKGDRTHPTMRVVAAGLSDQDIADLAAYYGGARQAALAAEAR